MTMENYRPSTYGDRIADIDELPRVTSVSLEPAVAGLAELAGPGPVLELGIGTGRIALPLAARGIEVHGIDASEAMVAELRSKDGGDSLRVTMGDFTEVDVEGQYSLVFVVFNTFFALQSQEDQVRCFGNVAKHLTSEGVLAIEAFVPDLSRFVRGQNTQTTWIDTDTVVLGVNLHEPVNQVVVSQHVVITEAGTKLYPVPIRYAYPSELDLMARLAGLRLRERWSDWDRSQFTGSSAKHVSIYERV